MGYMKEYMIIIIIICLVFHLTGALAESGTPNSLVFRAILNPEIMRTSTFYITIFLLIGAAIAASAVAGAGFGLVSKPPEFFYFATMFYLFIAFGWDLIGIFGVLNNVNTPLAILSISPFLIIYILTAVEWVRGM